MYTFAIIPLLAYTLLNAIAIPSAIFLLNERAKMEGPDPEILAPNAPSLSAAFLRL